ncbi:MFS transporter [Brevibacterium linens]|uniref:MFS transporter n=1 Tax=Brevibacterium linens TaxID=1703 RepID=UPI0035189131
MITLFGRLWASACSSNLGDGITLTALPLIALAAGASPGEVALVTTAATIAWPLCGLHAGWIVDRLSPQMLLTLANGARCLALLGLTAAIALDAFVTPTVMITALVYGVAETLVDTSLIAGIPRTVTPGQLTGANAKMEATINVANELAGPPLAGFLLGAAGLTAATVGSGLYALAAVAGLSLLLAMRRQATPAVARGSGASFGGAEEQPPPRVRDGLRYLWADLLQRDLTLLTAAMSFIWGAWTAIFALYAVTPGPLGLSTVAYGWVLAAMAIGGLVAASLVERLQTRLSTTFLLFIDSVGTILLVLPAALGAPLPVIVAGMILAGAGSTIWRVVVAVIRQRTTPLPLLGRVYSASRVISWGALPLGSALAALAVEALDIRSAFLIASAAAVAICLWFAVRYRGLSARVDDLEGQTRSEYENFIQPNG